MKQLVNTKNGLEEIDVSLAECLTDVAKNWCKELHAKYDKDGIVLHVLSSGVIFAKQDWKDDWIDEKIKVDLPKNYNKEIKRIKNVDYSKAVPTKLTSDGQTLLLDAKGLSGLQVHRVVAEAFYGTLSDKEVHHRDNNALNNQLWNLIALTHDEHNNIHNKDKKNPSK